MYYRLRFYTPPAWIFKQDSGQFNDTYPGHLAMSFPAPYTSKEYNMVWEGYISMHHPLRWYIPPAWIFKQDSGQFNDLSRSKQITQRERDDFRWFRPGIFYKIRGNI